MTMISEALSAELSDPAVIIHSAGYWTAKNRAHHAAARRARHIRERLEDAGQDTSIQDMVEELTP